jgi:transposase-like protein
MTTRKTHTAAFKAQIVQQVLREDKTLAQIAAEHGIHPNQISQWKATALQGLPTIFERGESAQAAEKAAHDKQTEKLYEQIGRLTTQLTWLKKKSGLDPDQV